MKQTFLPMLLVLLLAACKKNDDAINQPPQDFVVSISNLNSSQAQLNWTEAKDPENESVTYSVELKGEIIASNLNSTNFMLKNLTENQAYSGKVIAKDAGGLKKETNFNFSTTNSPTPSTFTVSLSKATYKTLEIFWTASTLPDNSAVTYDVYVNNTLKRSGIPSINYTVSGLDQQTQYNIKVVAKSAAGKSTEITKQFSTIVNQSPGSFNINLTEGGVSNVNIAVTKPLDPEQEPLTYFTVIDNIEKQIFPIVGTAATFNYRIEGLNGGGKYNIAILAKDEGGASVLSNSIAVNTYKSPENNFVISPVAEGNKVAIEFITETEEKISLTYSRYLIGDEWRNFSNETLIYTTLPDGKINIKILIDDVDLRTRYNVKFPLNLRWTPEDISTFSTVFYYTHFTSSSAKVSKANIKGPGAFPPQWTVNFENCVISDFGSWEVMEIAFDNVRFSNFVGFAICDPSKTGYYTGNSSNEQFSHIKTKSTGYVIVKDAGGYHKLDFIYSWQE